MAPRTPAEELLAEIWAEVLGHRRVGVDDNFFALGGDSIRSIRVVARRGAGLELSVEQLFRLQTIAELAPHLAGQALAAGAGEDDLARLVAELEGLSDAEAEGAARVKTGERESE